MTTTSALLMRLWKEHVARRYPHNRPAPELGSSDPGDLIELDTFVAGYVSRIVDGEKLSSIDFQRLAQLSLRVRDLVEEMSGETRTYFESLAQLAETAELKLAGQM